MKNKITVSTEIFAPIEKVWNVFNNPIHNINWNVGSPDWHTTKSEVDLKVGGKFCHTMAAKDGSESFDFWGTYTNIEKYKTIDSKLGDDRILNVEFVDLGDSVILTEIFDAEDINSIELQKSGWQGILDKLKEYVENL